MCCWCVYTCSDPFLWWVPMAFCDESEWPLKGISQTQLLPHLGCEVPLRTYSTENVCPYSASITQCNKGPTDYLWVAVEPPLRVLDRFWGRRPLTHLRPELWQDSGRHVTSCTGVQGPRDHLWVASEPPQRVPDCFRGRCPSMHLPLVGSLHVTSCKGALRPRDHLRVAIEPPQRVPDCFWGRRPLTHLQPKLRLVGGHHIMSHTGVAQKPLTSGCWAPVEGPWPFLRKTSSDAIVA